MPFRDEYPTPFYVKRNLRWIKITEKRLLPCPFCGGDPRVLEQHFVNGVEGGVGETNGFLVGCKVCQVFKRVYSISRRQIIAEWNIRNGIPA